MPGTKGRSGGGRTGTGPKPTSVKALAPLYDAIKAAGQRFNPPGQPIADIYGLHYCPGCGRWGWDVSVVTVWGDDWGIEAGAMPLTTDVIWRKVIAHSKSCKYK